MYYACIVRLRFSVYLGLVVVLADECEHIGLQQYCQEVSHAFSEFHRKVSHISAVHTSAQLPIKIEHWCN